MEYHFMLGEFICQRRKELGYTQKELAAKVGISDKAVSKWETLEANPDISLLLPLSDVLQVSVEELLKGELAKETEAQPCREAPARITQEKPIKAKPRKRDVVAFVALIVISVICGLVMLFAVISLAIVGSEKPDNSTALIIVFAVLLVLFGTAFTCTVKKAVYYSAEINEIPTEQKEVGGYIIYKNLSRAEKRALDAGLLDKNTKNWFVGAYIAVGVSLTVCGILNSILDSPVFTVCILALFFGLLAIQIGFIIVKTKRIHQKKIIMTKQRFERLKREKRL